MTKTQDKPTCTSQQNTLKKLIIELIHLQRKKLQNKIDAPTRKKKAIELNHLLRKKKTK